MYSLLLLLAAPLLITANNMAGDINTLDVNNSENLEKIWTGLDSINAASNSPNYLVPVKVLNATTQVVAGTKYTWEVLMAETDCNKANSTFDRNTCVPSANAPTSLYKISLWAQPWNNFYEYSAEKITNNNA